MSKKNIILISLFCSLAIPCYAQVADIDGKSKPYLNQQLRETVVRLNNIENYTINSLPGILTIDKGGTGADLSAYTADSLLVADGSGSFNEVGHGVTGDTLTIIGTTPTFFRPPASVLVALLETGEETTTSQSYVDTTGIIQGVKFYSGTYLIKYSYDSYIDVSGGANVWTKILAGSTILAESSQSSTIYATTSDSWVLQYISSGTYDVKFQLKVDAAGRHGYIKNMKLQIMRTEYSLDN